MSKLGKDLIEAAEWIQSNPTFLKAVADYAKAYNPNFRVVEIRIDGYSVARIHNSGFMEMGENL
jgi:hypothetical protein